MTDTTLVDLGAIRMRAENFLSADEGPGIDTDLWGLIASGSARDVPALLAEVERLRSVNAILPYETERELAQEVDRLRAELAKAWAEGADAGYADGTYGRTGSDVTPNPYPKEETPYVTVVDPETFARMMED